MAEGLESDCEGAHITTGQQINEFVDNVTTTTQERLSLDGQLKQALISLERYIDEEEQILTENEIVIPKLALSKAKGIVFLSLIKCGFVVAGCVGTGCILVRDTTTDKWSGPSSIACAGLSVGLLAGASKVDYILILPNQTAVKSFMSSGQLRIGGDLSVTVGTVGRDAFSDIGKGDVGSTSIVYSYSHSRGLYGGISLHGIGLSVRKECNEAFYGQKDVSNRDILSGHIRVPQQSNEYYHRIVHILTAYCHNHEDQHRSNPSKEMYTNKHLIAPCSCKLCQGHGRRHHQSIHDASKSNSKSKTWDETNPFFNDHIETTVHPMNPNHAKSSYKKTIETLIASRDHVTVHRVERKMKPRSTLAKTKILKETFLESTPTPPAADDGLYRYDDEKVHIVGDEVVLKVDDPWDATRESHRGKERELEEEGGDSALMEDPYALNVRPWDKLIDPAQYGADDLIKEDKKPFTDIISTVKEHDMGHSFRIDSDIDDDEKVEDDTRSETVQKGKNENATDSKAVDDGEDVYNHYSDHNVSKYSLNNYDSDGYRINTFSLLFQIGDTSYETSIDIAGKLVSKQYIVNWPRKHDCKCVIIVTSKVYSSYIEENVNDGHDYELRLLCYDARDDDLIVYDIEIALPHIKQLVNAINGAFTLSPGRPWIVLEAIFSEYNKTMYESMIDVSTNYHRRGVLQYGDLLRINFGSLCQYGLYVGEQDYDEEDDDDGGNAGEHYVDRGEIICFRRRFPNNGSSAFKKYRLMMMVFSGKVSKRITMQYCTLKEFVADCSRIEVVYYPIPCISPMAMVKRAILATTRNVKNCNIEYSPSIQARLTPTPLESIEDGVLTVLDGIAGTVNSIVAQTVSPTSIQHTM